MNKAIKNTDHHLNSDDKRWYQRSVDETFSLLSTEATGLTKDEVDKRLAIYGHNEVEIKKRSAIVRFLLQFRNPLIYVL
ncbi:MAG: cation-transporting P-type ATPase, partial [Halobacteriota archaeon]|nr:cation-transporting P-type ATPase [Halobacteriota archaeon]